MTIDSDGDVGIGTTNPSYNLDVVNNSSVLPTLRLGSALASAYGGGGNIIFAGGTSDYVSGSITWINNTITRGKIDYNAVTDIMAISSEGSTVFINNTAEAMRINSSGYLGIATTSPSYPLTVNTNSGGTSIYATNDIVAFSDQSVKNNIRPIENVIERINNSRGVLYDRTDCDAKDNIGFIAQELEVNFPELVITNEDGTKAVKYQNTVAVLFEAIKEQQKQIDQLKQIVDGLTK
jgi:hypothetical protein